ncbi:HBL/NHE enterotoxin family protein [Portibacter marinus]|uniref:HBL/NHE enterotoxin family protein n=1 Tax=Portibacter marinus TaxID=2898660 RepID=UPI001F29FA0C|nr:HBL/NHE enterotoxin family protein [Portibacter marinus]
MSTKTAKLVAFQPSKQQLADYANAVGLVNNYAYAITNQQLPVLNYPPDNYGKFTEEFAPAKQHALNWSQNIFVSMIQLPNTIKTQAANLFSMEETFIEAYLNNLISDPTDQKSLDGLKKALASIVSVIQAQKSSIDSIESSLTDFATNIAADAKTLAAIAADALADAGDDQTKITKLNEDIESLQQSIQTAQTLLTVSEIGMGLSLFVGLVGAVIAFIPGGQALGVAIIVGAVAGEAASIAGTVIEKERIKAMTKEISSDQKQISGLNQDIIVLKAISSQFNALYSANQAAAKALTSIKAMWENLENTIKLVSDELTTVTSDVAKPDYQKALNDFKTAEDNWNQVVAFADALAGITYKWQDKDGNWHTYGETNPTPDNGNVTVSKAS